MMNTWNFFDNIFTNRVDRAILALEAMSNESGSLVLDFLLEHETASALDLLVQTRLDSGTLDDLLTALGASGVLQKETGDGGVHYRANLAKIGRIRRMVAQINQQLLVAR
ncbi:MAG: hypothetical protein ACKV1O_12015 [Saprospiraceae bacterium]